MVVSVSWVQPCLVAGFRLSSRVIFEAEAYLDSANIGLRELLFIRIVIVHLP